MLAKETELQSLVFNNLDMLDKETELQSLVFNNLAMQLIKLQSCGRQSNSFHRTTEVIHDKDFQESLAPVSYMPDSRPRNPLQLQ